jgi:glycolate oxidase iron-sulfur subunit
MAKNKELKDYREEIEQCVMCGTCRAHCPVFGSCHAQCPNKVPTEEIVAATRREIAKRKGLSTFGKGVTTVLKNQGLMKALVKGGSAFSALLFKKLPDDSGLRLRFPAPFISRDRTLPNLTAEPFRDRHPEFIPGDKDQPTIIFFTGCAINYMYPEIGEAMLKTLRFLGINIIIPKDQGCCGLPAVSAGDGETVEKLAEQNLSALSAHPADWIVTACASCNAGIGEIYAKLGEEFGPMTAKVKDIFVFLIEQGFADKLAELPAPEETVRVTYHDPCHLRTQGITREPRQILEALPQVEYIEMEDAGTCCGMGGTYSVYHYETSKKIGAKKAGHIEESGADFVATDCPGCIMQLQDNINHAGGKQKAVHILDLVAACLP